MTNTRRGMVLDLGRPFAPGASLPAPDAPPLGLRPLLPSDAAALAALMLDAYRGTPDDEGEDLEQARAEVQRSFEGAYGPLLWEASFVVAAPEPDALLAASVITLWREAPLLAFSVTHPRAQRRGLAAATIGASAAALLGLGATRLELVVTRGNTPAERLYEKLGFRDIA